MSPDYLLDTNIVNDLMKGHAKVLAKLSGATGKVFTSAVVVGEIQFGLMRLPKGKRRNDLETRARQVLAALAAEPITSQVAVMYGSLKQTMTAGGCNMTDNDLWIAASALTLRSALVTRDAVFTQVPGLTVEDWTK